MINVQGFNEGLGHDYFELLRMLYPSFMGKKNLDLKEEGDWAYLETEDQKQSIFLGDLDQEGKRLRVKQFLFQDLDLEGRVSSPFGILTGVRPVKLVLELLDQMKEADLLNYLQDHYLIEGDMAELLVDIAHFEKKAFADFTRDSYSLYVHIPFCPSRCDYCSYPMIKSSNQESLRAYVDTLVKEIGRFQGITRPPSSIYLGGGTPTSLGPHFLEKVLDEIVKIFPESPEFTVEAGRPDTLTQDVFSVLRDHGVTRISINPQSMQEKTLRRLNRQHSIQEIYDSFALARDYDFTINMDLIVGLLGEGIEDFRDSLEKVIQLNPENITIHTLSLKNGSKLFEQNQHLAASHFIQGALKESRTLLREKTYEPYYLYRQKKILSNGYNVGYGEKGTASLYNMAMMEEQESILGLGMSSSSKFYYPEENRIEKVGQYKNLRDYLGHWQEKTEEKLKLKEDFQW